MHSLHFVMCCSSVLICMDINVVHSFQPSSGEDNTSRSGRGLVDTVDGDAKFDNSFGDLNDGDTEHRPDVDGDFYDRIADLEEHGRPLDGSQNHPCDKGEGNKQRLQYASKELATSGTVDAISSEENRKRMLEENEKDKETGLENAPHNEMDLNLEEEHGQHTHAEENGKNKGKQENGQSKDIQESGQSKDRQESGKSKDRQDNGQSKDRQERRQSKNNHSQENGQRKECGVDENGGSRDRISREQGPSSTTQELEEHVILKTTDEERKNEQSSGLDSGKVRLARSITWIENEIVDRESGPTNGVMGDWDAMEWEDLSAQNNSSTFDDTENTTNLLKNDLNTNKPTEGFGIGDKMDHEGYGRDTRSDDTSTEPISFDDEAENNTIIEIPDIVSIPDDGVSVNLSSTWYSIYYDHEFIDALDNLADICPNYRVCGGLLDVYSDYGDVDLYDRYTTLIERTSSRFGPGPMEALHCCTTCRCDVACHFMHNCCPDWLNVTGTVPNETNIDLPATEEPLTSLQEQALPRMCTTPVLRYSSGRFMFYNAQNIPDRSYWTITSCDMFGSSCGMSGTTRFHKNVMLYEPRAGVLFRTEECAACFDFTVDELVKFRLTAVDCPINLYDSELKDSELEAYILRECFIVSEPPLDIDASNAECFITTHPTHISECPNNASEVSGGKLLRKLCRDEWHVPVFQGSNKYTNPFCYYCNNGIESDTTSNLLPDDNHAQNMTSCQRTYDGKFRDVGPVYDLFVPDDDDVSTADEHVCTIDHFLDPYTNTCRPFSCPLRHGQWFGRCRSDLALFRARQRLYKVPVLLEITDAVTEAMINYIKSFLPTFVPFRNHIGLITVCWIEHVTFESLIPGFTAAFVINRLSSRLAMTYHIASSDGCDETAILNFINTLHRLKKEFLVPYDSAIIPIHASPNIGAHMTVAWQPQNDNISLATVLVPFMACPSVKLTLTDLCSIAHALNTSGRLPPCPGSNTHLAHLITTVFPDVLEHSTNINVPATYYVCVDDLLAWSDVAAAFAARPIPSETSTQQTENGNTNMSVSRQPSVTVMTAMSVVLFLCSKRL